MTGRSYPIYYCVFDGKRCKIFIALHRRKGLYFAVGCVVDKNYKNLHNCSRYIIEKIGRRDIHHCPFDGDLCKNVRGCQDALFYSNELPIPGHCPRAKINFKGSDCFD